MVYGNLHKKIVHLILVILSDSNYLEKAKNLKSNVLLEKKEYCVKPKVCG